MNIARAVPTTAAIIAAEATTATPAGSHRRLAPRNAQASDQADDADRGGASRGDPDDHQLVVGHASSQR